MKLKQFIFALVAMLLGFSVTASAQQLLVNCDYNSSTEGWGTTKFSNYAGAYAYATANGKTSATIVIEKTNTISGNTFDNNHKNYSRLAVVIKDGATMGNAASKWDMTYPVTVEPGGTLTCARPKNSSVSNIHIKNKLIVGAKGATKKAYVNFLSDSYQDCDISIRYNGSIEVYNADFYVQDLDAQGKLIIEDSNVEVDGAFASATFYATTLTNSTITINGNQISGGLSDFAGGTSNQLGNVKLNNSTLTINEGDTKVAANVTATNSTIAVNNLTVNSGKTLNLNDGSTLNAENITTSGTGAVKIDGEQATIENGQIVLPVAQIGTEKYATLADAVAAAQNDATITLIGNVELAEVVTIPADKTLTIDLNGKSISMQESIIATAYAINNLGNLTIKDGVGGGSVNARGMYNGYGNGGENVASATMTILGGTFNAMGTNGGAAIFNYGTANVNAGTFTSIGGYSLNNQAGSTMTIAAGVSANNGVYNSNATLTIDGGEISGNRSGCHVIYAWNSTLTINGGEFYNNNSGNATIMSAGTSVVTINGGTFGIKDGRVPGNSNTWTSCLTDTQNSAQIIVNGGTFNGGFRVQAGTSMTINGGSFNDVYGSNYNIYGTVTVTGGTFTDDTAKTFASKYVAEGYELNEGTVEKIVVAKIGDVEYATLSAAFKAVTVDNQTVVICKDVTENLTATLRGNITTENGAKVTITLTNEDWVYCPYTFVLGENVTMKVPALFYYAGGAQINGTLVVGAYYQRYAGTKLTINEPGSMTVTGETCIIRYMDGDANAGIYVVGDNNNETIGLNLAVAYFYQGMINAKDANIQAGVYWQTNETDGQGSANLFLDNSTLNVTVNEHDFKATGNSTVTLQNNSSINVAGSFVAGDNTTLNVDATSAINDKNGVVAIPAAKIGTTKYATLDEAFAAATADQTITLLADVTLSETYVNNKTLTIDLNGKTLSTALEDGSTTRHLYAIHNYGELTITDSSDAKTGKISARGNYNYGKLTLEAGTIDACDGNGGYAVNNVSGSEFIMNGGAVTASYEDGDVPGVGYDATAVRVESGAKATINGGEINNSANYTFAIDNAGEVTVNGGTVQSVHTTVSNYGTLTINDGSFTCNGLEGTTAHVIWATEGSTTTINGGTFNGKDNYNGFNVDASQGANVVIKGGKFLPVHSGSLYGEGTITVSGGTFFDEIDDQRCELGFQAVVNTEGTYDVKRTDKREAYTIVDGNMTEFVNEAEIEVGTLTYKRSLASDLYNALYVPFEIPVADFSDKYEFYYFNDVHSDVNGVPSSFEIVKITEGTLKANHPYLVKPINAEDKNMVLEITGAQLRSTTNKRYEVDCSSAYTLFTVRGTYSVLNGADYPGCYGMSVDGDLALIGNGELGAFRIYLQITDREKEQPVILPNVNKIRLRVIGEGSGDTTDIKYYDVENQNVELIFDLQGRRVLEPKKGGLYIINGKKVYYNK